MKTVSLNVNDMSCNHCVSAIKNGLMKIDVISKINLEKKLVEVTYNENQISLEEIQDEIGEIGYTAVRAEY